MISNGGLGLLAGTFLGSLMGTVGTIIVFKKLGKLEEKKLMDHEIEHVEEVKRYYQEKIKEIQNNIIEAPKCIETAEKNVVKIVDATPAVKQNKSRITYEGLDVEGGDNAVQAFDYSKISRDKYTDLKKEYEREAIEVEEDKYPIQIRKCEYERPGGYVKEELIYYEQNGIFADMEDNIVNYCTEQYFGPDNLLKFGSEQASLDGQSGLYEIYLRDEELHKDYHIIYNGTEDFEHLGDCR